MKGLLAFNYMRATAYGAPKLECTVEEITDSVIVEMEV
jgi:hypothetical protein